MDTRRGEAAAATRIFRGDAFGDAVAETFGRDRRAPQVLHVRSPRGYTSLMNRGDAAAVDIPWGRVAATPRPRRGYSAETSRGRSVSTGARASGTASATRRPRRSLVSTSPRAAATCIFSEHESRRRGYSVATSRTPQVWPGAFLHTRTQPGALRPGKTHLPVLLLDQRRFLTSVTGDDQRTSLGPLAGAATLLLHGGRARFSARRYQRLDAWRPTGVRVHVGVLASPRLVSTERPRRGRGGAATRLHGMPASRPRRRRDPSPRTIRVAAAASPRLVPPDYPRRGRGVAAEESPRNRRAETPVVLDG